MEYYLSFQCMAVVTETIRSGGLWSDNMRQMAAETAALISAKNKEIVIHKNYPPACFRHSS